MALIVTHPAIIDLSEVSLTPWVTAYKARHGAIGFDTEFSNQKLDSLKEIIYTLGHYIFTPSFNSPEAFGSRLGIIIGKEAILANNGSYVNSDTDNQINRFLFELEYNTQKCPHKFAGEADLKKVTDELFIGGYSCYSDLQAFQWIASHCNINIVPVKLTNQFNTFLDQVVYVIDEENILINQNSLTSSSLNEIARYVNTILVPESLELTNVTSLFCAQQASQSGIPGIILGAFPNDPISRSKTKEATEWLYATLSNLNYRLILTDLGDYHKLGISVSRFIMKL